MAISTQHYYTNVSKAPFFYKQMLIPLETPFESSSLLRIKRIGHLFDNRHFRFEKINMEYNLHFVVAGRGRVISDGIETEMKEGDVYMFFPGHSTIHTDSPESPWEYYWLCLDIKDTSLIDATGLSEEKPGRPLRNSPEIWNYIVSLFKRIESGNSGPCTAISEAWRIFDMISEKTTDTPVPLHEQIKRYVDSAEKFPGVKETANALNISRATVHRIFSENYGLPLKEYVDAKRHETACKILENSSFTVRQTAAACGFSSVQYFCRAFRKLSGISPSEWRATKTKKSSKS